MKKIKTIINETYKIFANVITNEKIEDINEVIWKMGYIVGRREEQRKKGELEQLNEKEEEKFFDMLNFVETMLMSEETYNKRYKSTSEC